MICLQTTEGDFHANNVRTQVFLHAWLFTSYLHCYNTQLHVHYME